MPFLSSIFVITSTPSGAEAAVCHSLIVFSFHTRIAFWGWSWGVYYSLLGAKFGFVLIRPNPFNLRYSNRDHGSKFVHLTLCHAANQHAGTKIRFALVE